MHVVWPPQICRSKVAGPPKTRISGGSRGAGGDSALPRPLWRLPRGRPVSGALITGPHCHQGPSVGWSPLAPRVPCLQGRSPSLPSGPHTRKSSAPQPRTAGRPWAGAPLVPSSPPAERGGAVLLRGLWALEDPACGHPAVPPVAHRSPLLQTFGGRARLVRPRDVRARDSRHPPRGTPSSLAAWGPRARL